MKNMKRILAIVMIAAISVVYMPWIPGTSFTANAEGKEFYAVLNTAAEGTQGEAGYKPANTLSFYYDVNKASHIEETKTVYDSLPTEATESSQWGYLVDETIRESIKNVVIDASVADYTGLKSTAYMFFGIKNADNISGCEYLNVSNVTNMSCMFFDYAQSSTAITTVPNVSNWDTSKVTDMGSMFCAYAQLSTVIPAVPNVSNWDTSKVTDMSGMFSNYAYTSKAITEAPDVSDWDTGNVTDMKLMFAFYAYQSNIINAVPDVSNWKTSNVTDMTCMFNKYAMFSTAITTVPDVSDWDTSKVTHMSQVFAFFACRSTAITAVPDVSNWDTSNVTDMFQLFSGYAAKSTVITAVPDVSNWDTSKVTNMNQMFSSYATTTTNKLDPLDLSNWDISALKDEESGNFKIAAEKMFNNYNSKCSSGNPVIYATDWSKAKPSGVTATDMFTGSKLRNAAGVESKANQWSFANTGDSGCFTAQTKDPVSYINAKGATKTRKVYTVVEDSASAVTWNAGWYVVNKDVTISKRITCNGAVHLILVDGAKLTASKGITCTGGDNSFTVYGQSGGTGELVATGESKGAGIGGGNKENGSNITINGGVVNATGGYMGGAGIGGGPEGTGNNITINGGMVTATGDGFAAGIGGGNKGNGSKITINGGTVNATGNTGGAGIGGGLERTGNNITINGGTVTAIGSQNGDKIGAGIGNSSNGSTPASNIKISTDLAVYADGNNPPKTAIANDGGDIASSLAGKQYATVNKAVASITSGDKTTNYLTVQEAITAAKAGDTVKLLSDVDLTATLEVVSGKNFTLDLNGKTLDAKNIPTPAAIGDKASVIYVNSGATLTLDDSSTGTPGKITGGKGTKETNKDCSLVGGGVYNAGTLTIKKISITKNTAHRGAGIYTKDTLNMESGEISDNEIENPAPIGAGGVAVEIDSGATFNMKDGTISGNKAERVPGVVLLKRNTSKFNMSGGAITDNIGSGAVNSKLSAGVTLSGTPKITGNKNENRNSNLMLGSSSRCTIDGLKPGAEIGVNKNDCAQAGAITYNGTADDLKYFTSDSPDYGVVFVEAKGEVAAHLELKEYVAQIGEIKYYSIQEAITAAKANETVKLIADSTENVTVASDDKLTLDLNGYVLKGTGTAASPESIITNSGTLTIKDSNTDAQTHYFTYKSGDAWEYIANPTSEQKTGAVAFENIEEATLESGTTIIAIKGGAITGNGIVNKNNLTVEGGNIVGNSNDWNGGILNDGGTLNVNNGKILGNKSVKTSGGGIINKQGTATLGTSTDTDSVFIAYNTGSNGAGGVLNYAKDELASLTINKTCTISYNASDVNGGGVENYAVYETKMAKITINGGEISNNSAKSNGGGICNGKYCELTLKNGTVKNNNADNCGGGIYNRLGTLKMTGGEVTSNTAKKNVGGVYNENGKFTMTGGKIADNTADISIGGVLNEGDDATFTVGGTAKISGNKYASTTVSNLVIPYGKTISIASGTDAPTSGMSIGVTMLNEEMNATITGKFTSAATADYSDKFFADDSANYEVRQYKNGETYLARVASNAPVCEITSDGNFKGNKYDTIAEALDDAGTTQTTIKLIKDVNENITIASGAKITLDLNGYVLKAKDAGSVITNNGTLTVKDSNTDSPIHKFTPNANGLWELNAQGTMTVAGGVITGGSGTTFGDNNCGGAIYNKGILTLEKANIVGNTATCGGGVALLEGSSFTMNGGTIEGNTSSAGGAGIFIWPGSSFTMNDGATIKNNTATDAAGGVYVAGTFTLNGGEISNNKAGSFGGGVYVYKKASEASKASAATTGFEMKGGKITSNSAQRRGGGVCIDYYDLGMKMTGGEISGNTVTAGTDSAAGGGGIWVGKSLTLGGTAVVKNNTLVDKSSNSVTNNVHMPLAKYSSNTIKPSIAFATGTEALSNGASIGISSDSVPTSSNLVAFTSNDNADYSKYFTSDNQVYKVKYVAATTTEPKVDAHLELVNYDIGQIASNTISITLENDAMTDEQAIAIARAQKPITGLSGTTLIVYAKADDFATSSKYKTIFAFPDLGWSIGPSYTLTDLKSGVSTMDIYVIGTVTNHSHDFTYKENASKKTITATCKNEGCELTESKVTATLVAEKKTYTGAAYEGASITGKDAWDAAGAATLSLKYKGRGGTSYSESATAPTKAGKYTVTMTASGKRVSADFEITKKQLEVTGTTVQLSKTYDGGKAATVTEDGTLTGMIGQDKVSLNTVKAEYANKNVGTGKKVTVSYTLKGDDAGNYTVKDTELTADITAKQLTISGTKVTGKTYDGTTAATATVGNLTNKEAGDKVKVAVKSAVFADANAEENKTVTVTYSISGGDAGNYLAPVDDNSFKATISKKQLKISTETSKKTKVKGKIYDGNADASKQTTAGTLVGVVGTDDVKVAISSSTYANANAGENKTVTVKYSISGAQAGNYFAPVDDNSFKATISKKQLTISTETGKKTVVSSKTYDGNDTAEVTAGTLVGVVSEDVVKVSATGTFENILAGKNKAVAVAYTISGADAANYLAPVDETLKADIDKIETVITITANSKSKVYDGKELTDTGYSYTEDVLLDGDKLSAVVEGSITNVGSSTNKVKNHSIMRGKVDVTDCYTIEYAQGELEITPDPKADTKVDTEALKEILKKHKDDGDKVAVEMRTDGKVTKEDKEPFKPFIGNKKAVYKDAQLMLIVDGDEQNIGGDNDVLVGITYKFDFTGKKDIQVFRNHEGDVEELTTTANENGEYVVFDKSAGTITIYACKYSTYAIAYDLEKTGTNTADSNDIAPWALMMLMSVMGLAGYGLKRKSN